ncbi:MAG: cellulase family glycosylhydrolase [Isosphaeraceae bacterium]
MRFPLCFLTGLAIGGLCLGVETRGDDARAHYVRVSPRDPRYFETDDGRPYIPNGLNLISPPWVRSRQPDDRLAALDDWLGKLAAGGGNHIRVWLSDPFYEVEHDKAGEYDVERAKRIDAMLAIARKHGIRVKMTIEHFREIDPAHPRQRWALKALHHTSHGGLATTMEGWMDSPAACRQFVHKLEFLAGRYRDNPTVYGWELWNEMNAVVGHGDYLAWTRAMLPELHRLFPHHLCMQSLGSYDSNWGREPYRQLALMPGNDVAQVHRYLDLGARLEICHGPVDMLAADAVSTLLAARPGKPVMLAESGAVEPSHSGPFKLYPKDTKGIILHDILFAPFFNGAAGSGQCWHWDQYVDANNLWWQFGRFASATKGLAPPAEEFEPVQIDHAKLRVYLLKGRHTWIAWCRDKASNWTTELAEGKAPAPLQGLSLQLNPPAGGQNGGRCRVYDPWTDHWSSAELSDGQVKLPEFSRSVVVRLEQ